MRLLPFALILFAFAPAQAARLTRATPRTTARSGRENPQYQGGLNNDNQTGIDFDGRASLNGGTPIAEADPQYLGKSWRNTELPGCGLRFEVIFVPLFARLSARERWRAGSDLSRASFVNGFQTGWVLGLGAAGKLEPRFFERQTPERMGRIASLTRAPRAERC